MARRMAVAWLGRDPTSGRWRPLRDGGSDRRTLPDPAFECGTADSGTTVKALTVGKRGEAALAALPGGECGDR